MSETEYQQLRGDIERRGILTPLESTSAGVVLDGRARLRAAGALGLERVPVRIVSPSDEVEYMVLAAIERRHMSPSQRAALMIAWSAFEKLRAQGEKRQRQNLRQNTEVATLPPRGKVRELLAELANVSARTVQDAITTYEEDPELFERVKAGTLAAPAAARRVRQAKRNRGLPEPPPLPERPLPDRVRRSSVAARKPRRPLRAREPLPDASAL